MAQLENNNVLRNFSALVDFSNLINSSLDINFTLNNLLLTCFGKFHTTKGIIALVGDDDQLNIRIHKGLNADTFNSFPKINLKNNPFKKKMIEDFIAENNFELFHEIISTDGFKGLIILGSRLSKEAYSNEDKEFLNTLSNIAATAIENSLVVDKLKIVNRNLDAKVNQLSALFDISKEFSGVLEVNMIAKLLAFSIIGQLLVSKFAVVTLVDGDLKFLENKFHENELENILSKELVESVSKFVKHEDMPDKYAVLSELGAEVVIPMQIKGKTKGIIILGARKNNQPFTTSDIEFASSVGSLAIISIENARLIEETLEKERLEKDLETAKSIQQNLLPSKIPVSDEFEIAAINYTARQVGGDYYDIVKLDDNRTLIAIADVSGKGVQAALLMANLQAFLKSICKQNIELDEASNLINDLISENTSGGSFITFFWGILNHSTKELKFVNAGHNPPLLIRNGDIDYLKRGGMILGVMPTLVPYESRTYQLKSGDLLVLFTDGITEAMNIDGKEYTDERFEELVKSNSHLSSAEIIDEILDDVKIYTTGAVQSDDITSLILKVK